jgi:hypothetical protein
MSVKVPSLVEISEKYNKIIENYESIHSNLKNIFEDIKTLESVHNVYINSIDMSSLNYSIYVDDIKHQINITQNEHDYINRTYCMNMEKLYRDLFKLYNRVKLELQKKPKERTPKNEVFKSAMKEYDRLVELSPDIPNSIIEEFKSIYGNAIDLIKPEIAGYIVSSKVYEPKQISFDETCLNMDKIISEESILKNDFIKTFKSKYGRIPTGDEINDHLELSNISVI